ncbi:hypothetical protein AK812_SmicGene41452 [Symbiodinium microadriaticum]|uniref:Uncharacterized protein n=1 Tax=Symbiodinium microadriaticum TaxID=2951 RepID=A0A1Q9C627_SYMMI|nr:hypothetical protein AK812_SmicGene41452 [Symbiodinium microadriaticum]
MLGAVLDGCSDPTVVEVQPCVDLGHHRCGATAMEFAGIELPAWSGPVVLSTHRPRRRRLCEKASFRPSSTTFSFDIPVGEYLHFFTFHQLTLPATAILGGVRWETKPFAYLIVTWVKKGDLA